MSIIVSVGGCVEVLLYTGMYDSKCGCIGVYNSKSCCIWVCMIVSVGV